MSRVLSVKDRIIFPMDFSDVHHAIDVYSLLSEHVGVFKFGLEFIYSAMADLLTFSEAQAAMLLEKLRIFHRVVGPHAFLDAKLCDIPNTVKGASIGISRMGVMIFNVHASAGLKAVKAAVENKGKSLVFGVTVLTSIDDQECKSIFGDSPAKKVRIFAENLVKAGADGIICSPQELALLGDIDQLEKATPGVRPRWAAANDQERITTPYDAILQGADRLVIGRPISSPPKEIGGPVEAVKKISEEIERALVELGQS